MGDVVTLVFFWALVIGPCLIALRTGAHRDAD
jgi:hypothetical protein